MASHPHLKLNLLGTLEARTGSEADERHLAKGKPVALLAYLSLAPGQRASRERLATLLWSDGSSDSARQNLRQTLWYLKKRLGEVIVADDDAVALASGARTDVEDFLSAAQQQRFGAAVSAYHGDFIPDFAAPGADAFEEWADLERRRLRATYVACVEAAARMLLSSGRAAEAVPLARRAREVAPADPNCWRLLLECLVAARDVLGATAAVAQLEAEIVGGEVEPDPAIKSLLRSAKKLAGNGDATNGDDHTSAPTFVPDLVGRESEFRFLVDSWEGARRGHGRMILLTGAAGLGKTRLLADFAARVVSTRGRVVSVRAHPGNRTIHGSLAAQIAEGLAALPGAAAVSPGTAAVLVALSPLLASDFPGATADLATGEDAVRRRAAALGELLSVVAESTPLALLVDDAHWADAESIRLVASLRARADSGPASPKALLVVATRIAEDLRHHLSTVEELPLLPLDIAGVAEFVGRLAGVPSEPWSRSFIPRLHEVTHGIPLLLIETLQRLCEHGVLRRSDASWHATSAEELMAAMPLGSALQARVESLPTRERVALTRLATLGRPIASSELIADEQVRDWDRTLGELERRSFISRSERKVGVWHDEIARAALDLATADERLRAHAWVSDVLVARAITLIEFSLAAWHAMRAADDQRLDRVWESAVRTARRNGDLRNIGSIAEDVLPGELGSPLHRRILRGTPFALRLHRLHGIAAATALLFVLVGAGAAWSGAVRDDADSTQLFFRSSDTSSLRSIELRSGAQWPAGEPIEAKRVARKGSPLRGIRYNVPALPLPGGTGWIASRTFSQDSGGDEIVLINAAGSMRRVSPALGDDNGPSLSPDGRFVVFSTRRFDRVTHQAELVVHDLLTDVTRRLSTSDEDEVAPSWSPDGTRIAFQRYYQTVARYPSTCVINMDGSNERCEWEGLPRNAAPVVWMNSGSLLVQDRDEGSLYRLDTEQGRSVLLGPADGGVFGAQEWGVVACLCLDAAGGARRLMIAPLDRPHALRPITDSREVVSTTGIWTARPAPRAGYVESLRISTSSPNITVGANVALHVAGLDQRGLPIPVQSLQFSSSDTSVIVTRADGTLEPRVAGRAWIRVSAGGWRRDSIALVVTASSARSVLRETWSEPLTTRWRPFGDPKPFLVEIPDGRALVTNGDGSYPSGVYSRETFDPSRGISVELLASFPLTTFKGQTLGVAIIADPDAAALRAWDHTSLAGPVNAGGNACNTNFPAVEGGIGVLKFGVIGADGPWQFTRTPPPADFYRGGWHRIRLDLTPDGRCALSVDGEVVVRTTLAARVPGRVRVLIDGHSVGARMLVREVDLWIGSR